MKRFLSLLLALLLVFSLTACISKPHPAQDPAPAETDQEPAAAEEPADAKVFACEELRITLTNDYAEEESVNGYTGVYESSDSAVFILREDKSMLPDVDMDQYVELVHEANANAGREVGDVHRKDGIPLFEYEFTNPDSNNTFAYYTTMFESEEAFWLVQFTCFSADYKGMVSRFHTFARSVTFEE